MPSVDVNKPLEIQINIIPTCQLHIILVKYKVEKEISNLNDNITIIIIILFIIITIRTYNESPSLKPG